jgi:hypothetical protein
MIEVLCPCRGVAVELIGEPTAQFFCHCDDCQAAHCAAYLPVAMFPASHVRITRGEPTAWKLRRTPRITCRDCGTRIFADVLPIAMRSVMAHLLPAGMFKPMFQIQCQHAVRPVRDDLPHYKGYPARFGGADETVDW